MDLQTGFAPEQQRAEYTAGLVAKAGSPAMATSFSKQYGTGTDFLQPERTAQPIAVSPLTVQATKGVADPFIGRVPWRDTRTSTREPTITTTRGPTTGLDQSIEGMKARAGASDYFRNVVVPAHRGGAEVAGDAGLIVMPRGYVDPYASTIDVAGAQRDVQARSDVLTARSETLGLDYAEKTVIVEESNLRWKDFESRWAPLVEETPAPSVETRAGALGVRTEQVAPIAATLTFMGSPEQYSQYTKEYSDLQAATPDSTELFRPLENPPNCFTN